MKNSLFKNYDKYVVKTPFITLFLDKCRNNKIEILDLIKIKNEEYSFISYSKNRKKINKFNDVRLIKTSGLLNILQNIIIRKTTFICLIFSLCLYIFLSSKIIFISISGNQDNLIPIIKEELRKNNVNTMKNKIGHNKAVELEKIILKSLYKQIEWIEIRQIGVNIKVKFLKRRTAPIIPNVGTSIYAQKDGMIVKFNISSGVKMVKEYDYVKKGDLLVNDTLETSTGELKYIGAYGNVYAYTWYEVLSTYKINKNQKKDETEIYTLLLENNRAKIDKELTGSDEFLVDEKILSFKNDNNIYSLKIHYTLYEDITL